MLYIKSIVFLATSLIMSTVAVPQSIIPCVDNVCLTAKPICPPGETADGSAGCWGCCRPICRTICADATTPLSSIVPICYPSEILDASSVPITRCWTCCKPPCGTTCLTVSPDCIVGDTLTGVPGCWNCCPPLA